MHIGDYGKRGYLAMVSALALLMPACEAPEPEDEGQDVGETSDALGTPLPSCSTAGSSGYNSTTKLLTLALGGGVTTIVVSAGSGKIQVNGWQCVSTASVPLTTTNVSKIAVTGTAANEKVIWDNLPGSFGTTIYGTSGGVTVDMGTGTDSFMVRGTSGADKYQVGNSAAGDVYFDMTNDNKADIRVIAADAITVSTLGGADTFHARGGSISATNFDASVTSLVAATTNLIVYGGDGNDELNGGDGDDKLYGGAGDDTFKSAVADDGSDTFYGEAGNDLAEYTNRTAALTVDIGPLYAVATGTVDLTTLTYPTGLDAKTLVMKVDGGSNVTTTFATPADEDAVVSQINAAAGATIASLDASNHLVLTSPTASTGSIQIVSGTGLAALGLSAATKTTADGDDGLAGENDDVTYTVEKINGGSAGDTLSGSDVSNTINGNGGNDIIDGGPGNATCASDVDVLNGGDGDDTFDMRSASDCGDALAGGAGTDTADYQDRTAALTITIDANANDGETGEADKVFTDLEVVLGGSGADTITGGTGNDEIHGGPGGDTLNGGAGNDTLVGGTGDDTMNGDAGDDTFLESGNDASYTATIARGGGNDVMNGGAGTDTISYASRTATIDLTLCVDANDNTGLPTSTASACTDDDGEGSEADKVTNFEWAMGGSGADNLTGGSAAETFEGGAGDDVIIGGAGDDTLYGDDDDDDLQGGDGDDYIDGGADDDAIDGGNSDGDICVGDGSDLVAQVACEL